MIFLIQPNSANNVLLYFFCCMCRFTAKHVMKILEPLLVHVGVEYILYSSNTILMDFS